MSDSEDWINEAGYGARKKAEELRAEQSTFIRVAAAVLGVHTDERAWRKGAEGEEHVGKRLARLPDGWQVLHDLTIGTQGANLDHLVIGPPGVFTINTKYQSGRVTVYDRAILHNGHKTAYIPKALAEARKVQRGISRVVGREIAARGVLVFVGATPDIRKRPPDLAVLTARRIPRWFTKQKQQALTPAEVTQLAAAACLPQTWQGKAKAKSAAPERAPLTPRKAQHEPPEQGGAAAPVTATPRAASTSGAVTTRRWTRFGHDRVYVNDADDHTLGYLDLKAGTINVDDSSHEPAVREATESWRRSESS